MSDAADRSLAASLAESLDRHFERFVEAYQHRLFGFVLTLVGDAAEAEELAQDAFVSAYRALLGYEPARRRTLALRAWLFTIALNKVRNRARRAPALRIDDALGDALPAPLSDDAPGVALERDERVRAVHRALESLAPRYRMPVILRHIEGLSYSEIACVLDQPVGTAKANVHRGLALLRDSSEIEGVVA